MTLTARGINEPHRISLDGLSITRGECVVICGPNGSGKSSLLRLLGGVDAPRAGRVELDGQDVAACSVQRRAALFAWLPQHSQLNPGWTVEALVASARYRFSEAPRESERVAVELLSRYALGHLVGRRVSRISGGELKRVLLVSLVAQQAEFLLLDEPGNHLDPRHQISTYQALSELCAQGKTLIIVSHDVRLTSLLGSASSVRVLGIKHHSWVFDARLDDPRLEEYLSALYDVPFVPRTAPGALAVDLGRVVEEEPSPP